MSDTNQHIDPIPSLKAWLALDDSGRVMTLVEDPSFTIYVSELLKQRDRFAHALSGIRGSLTALATGGIGEIEFAEEVQEALDGI